MKMRLELTTVDRRAALGLLGAAGVTGLFATPVLADAKAAQEQINKIVGSAAPSTGAVTLDIPEIAENGNAVKVAFSVDSPMTSDDHVKAVHVMADGNPTPEVATFHFSPVCGECYASTRMRLAKTQNIIVLAEMSDGSFQQASGTIKVTIGGCGG